MKTQTHIPLQPWMVSPATRQVMDALAHHGVEARFVGGCVRDSLLHRPILDIDIATPEKPERVMEVMNRAGIRVVPTGLTHGTVTAVVEHQHFEITTLRHDVETFGRHARVNFTDDWKVDASRRDFTINAIFCDGEGQLYDPFDGVADLKAGRVRFVGRAEDRIREDVLRLLRYFRFFAHYGKNSPDEEALAACHAMAPLLPGLSGERVATEIFKLLAADDPVPVWRLMADDRVLPHFLPQASNVARLDAVVRLGRLLEVKGPVRRLAAVLDTDAEGVLAIAARLHLSNAQKTRLVELVAPPVVVHPGMDERAARHILHRVGPDLFKDLIVMAGAEISCQSLDFGRPFSEEELCTQIRTHLALADSWKRPEFPLKGRDVMDLGIAQGAGIGDLLKTVEDWWRDQDFKPDREACLAEMRRVFATSR